MKPIYVQDADWSITVNAFRDAKKETGELNLNFMTRLQGLWTTMIGTCSREKAAVVPHGLEDERGLVAHGIGLMEARMMRGILHERPRNGNDSIIKMYDGFMEEATKYQQRTRQVDAMLGGSSPSPSPAPPHRTSPALGSGRGQGDSGEDGDGAVRFVNSAVVEEQPPGQGDDGKPRLVKDAMPQRTGNSLLYMVCAEFHHQNAQTANFHVF